METRAMEHLHGRRSPEAVRGDETPPLNAAPIRARQARALRPLMALLLLAVAVPACGSSNEAKPETTPSEQARTTVRVENRSFLDHNIFVLRGGQRVRLGMVTGNSTQTFTIPANLVFGVTALSFLVDPVGGSRQPVSNELPVSSGDNIQLIIPPA